MEIDFSNNIIQIIEPDRSKLELLIKDNVRIDFCKLDGQYHISHLHIDFGGGMVSEFYNPRLLGLKISNGILKDASFICRYRRLSEHSINNCDLVKFSRLKDLSSLEILYLSNNLISKIEKPIDSQSIKTLCLNDNKFDSLSSLKNLRNVKELHNIQLSNNLISNLDSLYSVPFLKNLFSTDLSHNNIENITPMRGLKKILSILNYFF